MARKVKDTDYLYISTRIKAINASALTREKLLRAADAATDAEVFRVLEECGWPNIEECGSLENAIAAKRQSMLDLLYKYAPDRRPIDIFRLKYDYHNIKTFVKAQATDQQADDLLTDAGTIPAARMLALLRDRERGNMPEIMFKAFMEASDLLARTRDPQLSDMALDRAMGAQMLALAEETRSRFLLGYVRLFIDACNLRVAARVLRNGKSADYLERALMPGGNVLVKKLEAAELDSELLPQLFGGALLRGAAVTASEAAEGRGDMARLDMECDNALLAYLEEAKNVPFGEAHVISYVLNTENELTSVRTVMAGRAAGLSGEQIAERLRKSNV
ncbi:MAG: V-type ATPase subunit [Clostridia bacterium]|nr:V-type ATPase subunit [Clostridia bacterium]